MKNISISKVLASVVLMILASTFISYAITGSAASIALPIVGVLFLAGFVKGLAKINGAIPGALLDGFVISDTTYAGEAASQFIVRAITENDTINGGNVYVKDGIKNQFTIPRWDADFEDFVQTRAATPQSKGVMTVTGQALTPKDYMIYTEFNPRDYESHWFAPELQEQLIARGLPTSVESVVVHEVLKRHDKFLNKALWISDTTNSSLKAQYQFFDGFIKKAANLPSAQKITVVGGGLTAANIQAEMTKGYKAIPAPLRYDPNMKFFVSYATYDLFADSQIAQTYKGVDITQDGVRKFKGRVVVPIADFPDNVYVIAKGLATPESNLWVGMNSTTDAKLELKQLQANSEYWFIKMLMKVDVQFGWFEEAVLYS